MGYDGKDNKAEGQPCQGEAINPPCADTFLPEGEEQGSEQDERPDAQFGKEPPIVIPRSGALLCPPGSEESPRFRCCFRMIYLYVPQPHAVRQDRQDNEQQERSPSS